MEDKTETIQVDFTGEEIFLHCKAFVYSNFRKESVEQFDKELEDHGDLGQALIKTCLNEQCNDAIEELIKRLEEDEREL